MSTKFTLMSLYLTLIIGSIFGLYGHIKLMIEFPVLVLNMNFVVLNILF